MRKNIFTKYQRRLLLAWLKGEVQRSRNAMLNKILSEVKANQSSLVADFHLFIKVLRKLNLMELYA